MERKQLLTRFAQAWSQQDVEAIVSFFADSLYFEDIPFNLIAQNKQELRQLLLHSFSVVPDFVMDLQEVHECTDFVVTKWWQKGTATIQDRGIDVSNFPYSVMTTSIISFDLSGKISLVQDNWDTGVLYRS